MLDFLFGMLVRPHAVGPDGIPVRYGSEVDIPITWNDVYSVARRKQANQDKQPKVTIDDNDDATLHMRIQNETNIEVRLDRPVPLKLPYGTETVSQSSSAPTIGRGSSKPVDATFKGTRFAFADVSTDDDNRSTTLKRAPLS